jgi:hypothetical protein
MTSDVCHFVIQILLCYLGFLVMVKCMDKHELDKNYSLRSLTQLLHYKTWFPLRGREYIFIYFILCPRDYHGPFGPRTV